jgi:hypothetical protein
MAACTQLHKRRRALGRLLRHVNGCQNLVFTPGSSAVTRDEISQRKAPLPRLR